MKLPHTIYITLTPLVFSTWGARVLEYLILEREQRKAKFWFPSKSVQRQQLPLESREMVIRASAFVLSALCLSWTPQVLFGWLSCPQGIQKVPRLDPEGSTAECPIITHQVKRIAIIGAGTSGLAALKTFIHDIPKRHGERWEIDLFERRNNLGGIW